MKVKKFDYWVQVNVIDGVPQCACCQEPMVKRSDAWMCATGAAVQDYILNHSSALLDEVLSSG